MNRDYRRNAKDRAVINVLLTRNVPLKDIADTIGLSLNDLKKFYKPEIAELRPNLNSISNYMPTDQDRKLVAAAVAYGMPTSEIASLVGVDGISEKLLRDHFDAELRTGKSRMNFQVAHAIYRMATMWMNGKADPNRVNIDAAKFFAERRMGWTAKSAVDVNLKKPLSEYTDDELAALLTTGGGGGSETPEGEEEPT